MADPLALLRPHERWLRGVVAVRLRDSHAVDDVMQEVALALVRRPPAPDQIRRPAPWLYRLAVRQALLWRRRLGRRQRLNQAYAREPRLAENEGADPLEWLLADERQRLLRQALDRLAPRDAEVLLLKYQENWSYRQLAEHLGVTEAAIEARLHRARGRLREALAGSPVGEPR